MRPDHLADRERTWRSTVGSVPVAVAGTIALALSAAPAHADDRVTEERPLRSLPSGAAMKAAAVSFASRPAAAAPSAYTVQRGDTVSAIAARFGLRTADVLALNALTWKSVIHPGDVLTLVGGGAPVPPAATAPASSDHAVRPGDTIIAIAKARGISAQALLSANGLGWSSTIYPGQKLTIPGAAAAPAPPAAPATPPAAAPAPAAGQHTVRDGDTIIAIAKANGISAQALLAANGLAWSSIIYPGQTLAVPLAATPTASATPSAPGLDAEQAANAQLIIRIGRELGVPDRGIAIALGTAMQESWIRNLDWGDRDSLGLFQQRPSTGWGTEAEVRDPARTIRAFYGGASDPNGTRTRGLLDIPGWQDMSYAQAAQAVQISAYPDRYAQWERPAYAWLAALG